MYHHLPPEWSSTVNAKLDNITHLLQQVLGMEVLQVATIEDLQTEVGQNTDVTQSAIVLLDGLSQQLKDALAANDPAAIQAVVDQLDANTNALAEAVSANTPSSGADAATPQG